jgi:hypothetical protein
MEKILYVDVELRGREMHPGCEHEVTLAREFVYISLPQTLQPPQRTHTFTTKLAVPLLAVFHIKTYAVDDSLSPLLHAPHVSRDFWGHAGPELDLNTSLMLAVPTVIDRVSFLGAISDDEQIGLGPG